MMQPCCTARTGIYPTEAGLIVYEHAQNSLNDSIERSLGRASRKYSN